MKTLTYTKTDKGNHTEVEITSGKLDGNKYKVYLTALCDANGDFDAVHVDAWAYSGKCWLPVQQNHTAFAPFHGIDFDKVVEVVANA